MNRRIYLVFSLLFLLLASSCKKAVEDKKRDILLDAMTSGEWYIDQFQEGSTSITGIFEGFSFQFKRDGTVIGKKENTIENGIWSSDVNNYSIHSNFPDSSDPLKKLNGIWKITDTTADTVEAESTSGQEKTILHLRKKI